MSRLSWSKPFHIAANSELYVDLLLDGRNLYPLRPYKQSSVNTTLDILSRGVWTVQHTAVDVLKEIVEEGIFIDITLDDMIEFLEDMIARGARV